jgi:endonuclease/exonuclease/phosphatase family metal-dependent hydrolase
MPCRLVRLVVSSAIAASVAACALQAPPPHAAASLPVFCRAVVDRDGRPMSVDRISWDLLPESDDRAWLDQSCGAVGPAVIAVPESPATTMRASMDEVALVTWNMHGDAGELRALVESIRSGGPGQPPRSHVVLLLQEVLRAGALVPATVPSGAPVPRAVRTRDQPRDDIVALARALQMHLVYVPSMRNGREPGPGGPEDRGTAILSSLPLADVAAIELPPARHRRVAVAATVSADATGRAWRMRVATLHLDTVAGWRRLYLFASLHRARQAARVIDALGDEEPLVIGADLNTWGDGPAEPAVTRLLRAFPDTPSPRWQPTFQGLWRLDYLFFRLPDHWQADSRRLDSTFGSDHHPLTGRLIRPLPPRPFAP